MLTIYSKSDQSDIPREEIQRIIKTYNTQDDDVQ